VQKFSSDADGVNVEARDPTASRINSRVVPD